MSGSHDQDTESQRLADLVAHKFWAATTLSALDLFGEHLRTVYLIVAETKDPDLGRTHEEPSTARSRPAYGRHWTMACEAPLKVIVRGGIRWRRHGGLCLDVTLESLFAGRAASSNECIWQADAATAPMTV